MGALLEVCRGHNTSRPGDERIWVIEDCAHSHGAQWRLPDGSVRGTGAMGDFGSFSFQSSKSLSTGDGGIILTSDEELADRCWSLRNVGRSRHSGQAPGYGNNYRLTELQAAVLRARPRTIAGRDGAPPAERRTTSLAVLLTCRASDPSPATRD